MIAWIGLISLPYLVYNPPPSFQKSQVRAVGHGWVLMDLTETQVQILESKGVVVSPNATVYLAYTPSDPQYREYQGNLWMIGMEQAWDASLGNPSVRVGIVDQGVDYRHPDLKVDGGLDLIDGDRDVLPANLDEFHGSHVAGIIIGAHNNTGLVGIAPNVRFYAVRAFSGSTTSLDLIVAGIYWLVDTANVHVLNLSLGLSQDIAALDSAIQYATSRGVVVVAAAGNDGRRGLNYPARYPSVIAVGALDSLNTRASFSNFGPELDVVAPGTGIWSAGGCDNRGCYILAADGTSMATPHVTGLAALYLSLHPGATSDEVIRAIRRATIDLSPAGFDEQTGYGLVDAARLLAPPVRLVSHVAPAMGSQALQRLAYLDKEVYDRTGRKVFSGRGVPHLPRGIYVIRKKGSSQNIPLIIP